MAEYHFSCNNLPSGDLFTEAKSLLEARKNFAEFVTESIKLDKIHQDEPGTSTYDLKEGEVIEEH